MTYQPNENLYQHIKKICLEEYEKGADPVQLLEHIWEHPDFPMHCPEHHFLVSAVLLTAYRHLKHDTKIQLEKDLAAAEERGRNILPGFCGWYGACGAAIGSGIFLAILTDTNPCSTQTWGLVNLLTSECLRGIAEIGGPRCCKRVCFTAVETTAGFMKNHMNLNLGNLPRIRCSYHEQNAECRKSTCPYYIK